MLRSAVYSDKRIMNNFLNSDKKHTYVTTSWTNQWLNFNTKVL